MTFGSYAQWAVIKAKEAFPVPRPEAALLTLLTSGLTASIGAYGFAYVVLQHISQPVQIPVKAAGTKHTTPVELDCVKSCIWTWMPAAVPR